MHLMMLLMVAFVGVFIGVFSTVLYFLMPHLLPRQFAMCLTCESTQFDKIWEKITSLDCKKCKVPMELITMPDDFYPERVKFIRRVVLSLIPTAGVIYIMIWDLWIGLVVAILYFAFLIIFSYRSDTRLKREIIAWALTNFKKAKTSLDELIQAKQQIEQKEEPRPIFVNLMIGWYIALAIYFIYAYLSLFYSIEPLAIPENILLYISIGMLIATIIFSGGIPYIAKRNLAILKPLVLIRAIFYIFLMMFGTSYLVGIAFLGSPGSSIELILAVTFTVASFTSYFEHYFLWEKFVDSKADTVDYLARSQKYYLTLWVANSILGIILLSQLTYFQGQNFVIYLYLMILIGFADLITGATNTKLHEYWKSLTPKTASHGTHLSYEASKNPYIISEEFYKTKVIPGYFIFLLTYTILFLNLLSTPISEYDWYIISFPLLIKALLIGEFIYHYYQRRK